MDCFFLLAIFLYRSSLTLSESAVAPKKIGGLEDNKDRYRLQDLTFGLLHFTIIPCGKELWTNFNKYNFALLRTICYHFCYWVIKCAKVLHAYFISLCNDSTWIFYYRYSTSAFDSFGSKSLIIYGKIHIWFVSKILCFLGKF